MHTLRVFVSVGWLALAMSCGGNSSTSSRPDGGGGVGGVMDGAAQGPGGEGGAVGLGSGGGLATGAGGSSSGTVVSGTCTVPSCLSGFVNCIPSGTCVEQIDTTTFAANMCYSNGVKETSSLGATGTSFTVTVKQGGSVCYSISVPISDGGIANTFTVNNASGQAVATATSDGSGNTTVTCTGGSPVTIASNCNFGSSGASTTTSSSCTQGTCAP
ncbi:MAG: hypothetical protein ABSB49_13570 [Polyangia bacterium]